MNTNIIELADGSKEYKQMIYDNTLSDLSNCIQIASTSSEPRIAKLKEYLELLFLILNNNPPGGLKGVQKGGATISRDQIITYLILAFSLCSGVIMYQEQPAMMPAVAAMKENFYNSLGNMVDIFHITDTTGVSTKATVEFTYNKDTMITQGDQELIDRSIQLNEEIRSLEKKLSEVTTTELTAWENLRKTVESKTYYKKLVEDTARFDSELIAVERDMKDAIKMIENKGHEGKGFLSNDAEYTEMVQYSKMDSVLPDMETVLTFGEGIKDASQKSEFRGLIERYQDIKKERSRANVRRTWFEGKGRDTSVLKGMVAEIYGESFQGLYNVNEGSPLAILSEDKSPMLNDLIQLLSTIEIPAEEMSVSVSRIGWITEFLGMDTKEKLQFDRSNYDELRGRLESSLEKTQPPLKQYMLNVFDNNYYTYSIQDLRVSYAQTMTTRIIEKLSAYDQSVKDARIEINEQLTGMEPVVINRADVIIADIEKAFVVFDEKTIRFIVEEAKNTQHALIPKEQKDVEKRRLERISMNETKIEWRILGALAATLLTFSILHGMAFLASVLTLIFLKSLNAPAQLVIAVAERIGGRPLNPGEQLGWNNPTVTPAMKNRPANASAIMNAINAKANANKITNAPAIMNAINAKANMNAIVNKITNTPAIMNANANANANANENMNAIINVNANANIPAIMNAPNANRRNRSNTESTEPIGGYRKNNNRTRKLKKRSKPNTRARTKALKLRLKSKKARV